jgi:hypothetical protein
MGSNRRLDKLYNEGLLNVYTLPNIIRVIKSGRIRRLGHAASTVEMTNAYKLMVTNLTVRDHMGDIGVHGKIIFKWILNE